MIDCTAIYQELANAEADFILAAGGSCRAPGIFDNAFEQIGVGRLGIEDTTPTFTCAADPLSSPDGSLKVKERDTVRLSFNPKIPGSLYTILNVKPDHEGSVTFDLQEA